MNLSSKTCFAVIIATLALMTQPALAGGPIMSRSPSAGSFARPAMRPPAAVPQLSPGRNLGNLQSGNSSASLRNGNIGGIVRNSQLGTVNLPSARLNSNLTTKQADGITADPNWFPQKVQAASKRRHDADNHAKPAVPEVPETPETGDSSAPTRSGKPT